MKLNTILKIFIILTGLLPYIYLILIEKVNTLYEHLFLLCLSLFWMLIIYLILTYVGREDDEK